jgi:hypothetical protein
MSVTIARLIQGPNNFFASIRDGYDFGYPVNLIANAQSFEFLRTALA